MIYVSSIYFIFYIYYFNNDNTFWVNVIKIYNNRVFKKNIFVGKNYYTNQRSGRSMETQMIDVRKIEVGSQIDGFFLVKSVTEGVTTTGKPFLTLSLGNNTGEISSKLWDVKDEQKEVCLVGTVIKVRASVTDYQGKPQLKVALVRTVVDTDNVNLEDFMVVAPINKLQVDTEIIQTILAFENEEIRAIVTAIYQKYQKPFLTHFAAKAMHHAVVGGLAYHTSTMLEIAKRIAPLYPLVNKDYLYATIILHDIMKTVELSDNPLAPSYTIEGFLMGHIVMVTAEIKLVSEALIAEGVVAKDSLVPAILISNTASHHGKGEWGSPVEPRTIEAELVHHIDMIDSRMYMIGQTIQDAEPNTVVENRSMRRSFLAHTPKAGKTIQEIEVAKE